MSAPCKDRPIIFSAAMIRALLADRKSQTRRLLPEKFRAILRPAHSVTNGPMGPMAHEYDRSWPVRTPYAVGDRLWVKETWNIFSASQDGECVWPLSRIPTRAEFDEIEEQGVRGCWHIFYRESDHARQYLADQKWRSPIHIPRWASRLTLTVADVRVQRLHDISEADAIAEGAMASTFPGYWRNPADQSVDFCDAVGAYADLWDSIHGPGSWDENPWVCAISFETRKGNIDA